MNLWFTSLVAAFLLFSVSGTSAQEKKNTESPKARVNRQFAAASPQLGSLLPDITVFDRTGKPLPLRNLRDNYAVIIFGCLT